jgi:hypothetical protein
MGNAFSSGAQILVKTGAYGVCHTDLHAALGSWPVSPSLLVRIQPDYLTSDRVRSISTDPV